MATADEYAAWIVQNRAKRGTRDFETVVQAYEQAKQEEGRAQAPGVPQAAQPQPGSRRRVGRFRQAPRHGNGRRLLPSGRA